MFLTNSWHTKKVVWISCNSRCFVLKRSNLTCGRACNAQCVFQCACVRAGMCDALSACCRLLPSKQLILACHPRRALFGHKASDKCGGAVLSHSCSIYLHACVCVCVCCVSKHTQKNVSATSVILKRVTSVNFSTKVKWA